MEGTYLSGVDIGSTTAKVVICDRDGNRVFSRYLRHQAKTEETTRRIFEEASHKLGNIELDLAVTGSAGMGTAETFNLPFVQEAVASAHLIKRSYPEVRTFIEIGGEDSKIIFFDDNFRPDIRMNGSCAGGTGAFIDQMAVLLDVPVSEFNALAEKAVDIHPIASRCGVFAKTDIQALLSQDVSKEDIAASVFHAVAVQVLTALSRGRRIEKKILIGGGPLSFYPALRKAFIRILGIDNPNDLIIPEDPHLIPAMGAAFARNGQPPHLARVKDLLALPGTGISKKMGMASRRLPPLFETMAEFESWKERHSKDRVSRVELAQIKDRNLFLGIDSGSTTTKLVFTDDQGRFVLGHYGSNNGNPIEAVREGLFLFRNKFKEAGFQPRIIRTASTGYGEDLIRAAFGLDDGVVETMAHYRAARCFDNEVSFILDIGGQDMKAIYIRDHAVSDIQVNEACSSGCGSFIETFARSLGYDIADFAELACEKNAPFDLGTRCTVFMNSRVKQALREGASISEISAGLAYSVIKNSLYKVLKLRDSEALGDKIIAQGGTFRNNAVLRAFELLLKKDVIRPDIPELMGAYGAALTALANHLERPEESTSFDAIGDPDISIDSTKKELNCGGCENRCPVVRLSFANGNRFYTGNRCERYFSNRPEARNSGTNLIAEQIDILFNRNTEPEKEPILTLGIPRCLNMYENFPFWSAFLVTCGFRVVLSSPSDFRLFEKGASTVMSENICFPAKLAHGHVFDLLEKGVDRIFYPTVVHEKKEYEGVLNSFNCPVVTGYPDLLKSAIDPDRKYGIPIDNPAVSFRDEDLLKRQLHLFFRKFGVDYRTVARAVEKGLTAQKGFKREVRDRARALISRAENERRVIVVLAGRPYHIDPLINHGAPEFLIGLGVDVISENAVPTDEYSSLSDVNVLTQWTYTNRLYAAAKWVCNNPHAQLVQLTSFGCGPDAVSADEVREIIRDSGKIYTLIKMDEISNLGAVRIRLRSMLEAVKENRGGPQWERGKGKKITRVFMPEDRKRTLIAPYFSPFYSPLIPAVFRPLGYRVDMLPPQDRASVEYGLKNINNDMCYPAVLIAGDIIKAFQTGRYDPEETSVILTQTGGQCRASAYVSLIRKGLASAGLDNVPVIALSTENIDGDINPQPGFVIDEKGMTRRLSLGIIFSDPLAQMYLATMAREEIPGTSKDLHTKYLSEMAAGVEKADYHYLLTVLEKAVQDFNGVEIVDRPVPRIGVVGEIFVKYNFFSNGNIIEWLSEQGVEVVLPGLQGFFTQRFVNEDFDQKAFFKHSIIDSLKHKLIDIYVRCHLSRIDKVMQRFRFYRKPFNLKELAEITSEVVSLANQFGEGWLLTAEMIAMLNEGTGNIVCLQPFGCISNHITGRGLERKLKEMFPHLNLLSLDMDAGASEVNILNRLHFMIIAAKEEMEHRTVVTSIPAMAWALSVPHIWPGYLDFDYRISPEIEKCKSWVSGLGLWKKASDFVRR